MCVFLEFFSAGCVCGVEEFSASETHHSDGALDGGVSVHAGLYRPFSALLQDCSVPFAPDLQVRLSYTSQRYCLCVIVQLIILRCVCF